MNDKQNKLNQTRVEILKNFDKTAGIASLEDEKPFEIEWSFGWSCEIGLVSISNTETNDKLRAFCVSAQVGIILEYNYMTNKMINMNMLNGHRNCISSFDVNSDGRWLVTVDNGDNSMLIVWNSFERNPILTLLSPFKMEIAIVVKFSIDSKYLITVSIDTDGEQTIGLWDWMLALEEPTYSRKLDKSFKPVIHLSCCDNNPNFYCFTTKKHVFFLTLVENVKTLMINVPKKDPEQKKYNYTQSTYLTNFRQVVSASTGGSVTVWDDTNYNTRRLKNTEITNNKQFLQNIQLDDYSITAIICQRYIITGNTNGDIFIYDQSLLVLFHLDKLVGSSITSISMINKNCINKNSVFGSRVFNKSEYATKCVPNPHNSIYSELTTQNCDDKSRFGIDFTTRQEFKCDPFLISTKNCKIFQIDIFRECCVQIVEQFNEASVTALEVHPKKSFVVLGDSIGGLGMYHYMTRKLVKTVTNYTNSKGVQNNNNQVTCIKYSYNGLVLCYGCMDGSFWFVDPGLLTPVYDKPFRWNGSPVRLIRFSRSSRYVVYTDNTLGVYLYSILSWDKFDVRYHGCYEVHKGTIRDISIVENKTGLTIYSIGADHRIAIIEFDNTQDVGQFGLVKTMRTEPWHEPLCMSTTINKSGVPNLIISGSDLHLTIWNDNRCVRTTRGVNLESPIKMMKILSKMEEEEKHNIILFCNDTDIGIFLQPVDGNPFRNAAVIGSGTKLIDCGISQDNKFVFSISENSPSMLMWSFNKTYMSKLENDFRTDLKTYSYLLDGGENGNELKLLKEYFYCVQIASSVNPATVVFSDFLDVCKVSYPMRAMGCFPSELEISNMIYEMHERDIVKIGHPTTLLTFEEFVVLYLNHKPQLELKIGDIRKAFDRMVLYDHSINPDGEKGVLTREIFIHIMKNMGEKMSFRELEIIVRTLLKTTKDLSSAGSSENINLIHAALPPTLTFDFIISELFGFPNPDEQK